LKIMSENKETIDLNSHLYRKREGKK